MIYMDDVRPQCIVQNRANTFQIRTEKFEKRKYECALAAMEIECFNLH